MNNDKELMQMALDALITAELDGNCEYGATDALRTRLSQCERCGEVNSAEIHTCTPQEPVAWAWTVNSGAGYITRGVGFDKADIPFAKHTPLYTAPPQRGWQGLTENEIKHLWYEACQTNLELTSQLIVHLARNIEAKLKEMNT